MARAAYQEAKILWRRQPIEQLLRDARLDADRRAKLETVLAVREYAAHELRLRVSGSYSSISEIDGSAVVQVVTAARRDRLRPYTWWFPVVGRVPYKGFFAKESALELARDLEERGYDTYVRPSIAFSTLGWFDDPLPSTLLERNRVTLANVVFHELFHNTMFVPGHVDFNESAATFVGARAAIEFFCTGPKAELALCTAARNDWEDTVRMSRFLSSAIDELEDFYDSKPGWSALDKGRDRIFAGIRERFTELEWKTKRYAGFPNEPLNNATLLHDRLYLRDLDLFDELYRRQGSVARAVAALTETRGNGKSPFVALRGLLGGNDVDVASLPSLRSGG